MRRQSTLAAVAMPLVLAGLLAISADNQSRETAKPRNRPIITDRAATGVVPEAHEVPQPPLAHATASTVKLGRRVSSQDLTPPLSLARARESAAGAVRAYATQSTTWTWRTLARQYRRLAELSGGSLRRVNLAAGRDPEALLALKDDGAGSRARELRVRVIAEAGQQAIVEASAVERGYGRHAGTSRWIRGRYRAVARRFPSGWRVIAWDPRT
jgi:hypothetical protein